MASCDIIPLSSAKACSGKCRSDGCGVASSVWVLAACEGAMALFRKQANGHLVPVPEQTPRAYSLESVLREQLAQAFEREDFAQLVLVGSANDIAWTQSCLPESISKKVVAEIKYPLMSAWFSSDSQTSKLTQALAHVLEH